MISNIFSLNNNIKKILECGYTINCKNKIIDILEKYSGNDWNKYCNLKKDTYTRNLVYRCNDYQLVVMCWSPNFSSAIHNHYGS